MLTVLITEAGGPAAVGLIKTLKSSSLDIRIVATDMDPLASGLHMADLSVLVPHASQAEYTDKLLDLIKKYEVDLIIPTGEHDLYKLSKIRDKMKNLGCKIFVSDPDTVEICQNKLKFYEHLKKTDIPLPLTYSKNMILKPKRGSGSRGIKIVELEDRIIQEYLPGKEYTVDVFCDMSSNIINHVIRERVATKAGISTKSTVLFDKSISLIVGQLVHHLSIKGPACVQLRNNDKGSPHVIECNPRLGGGTYISTLAGVNYADIYLNMLTNKPNKTQKPKEITVTRYFEEIVL
jgi:carbamoyl-phosphate synthase large subunit